MYESNPIANFVHELLECIFIFLWKQKWIIQIHLVVDDFCLFKVHLQSICSIKVFFWGCDNL